MQIFSQQDPRWAKETLGDSVFTIGRWGCLNTVISMVRTYAFGGTMTPLQSAKKLSFNAKGELEWWSLANVGLNLVLRVRHRNDIVMVKYYKQSPMFIAIQVNNNHWVWMISRWKLPVLGYKIADPWTGKTGYTKNYNDNITGFAVVTKK